MRYTHFVLVDPTTSSINIMINHFAVDLACNCTFGSNLGNVLLNCMGNLVSVIKNYTSGCIYIPCVHSDYSSSPLKFQLLVVFEYIGFRKFIVKFFDQCGNII